MIEVRIDTFRVQTIQANGFCRRHIDPVRHQNLASALADARNRSEMVHDCICLAIDPKGFDSRPGSTGGNFVQVGGEWYSLAGNSGWCYDCWPVSRCEATPVLLDTADPAAVAAWVKATGKCPDPGWAAVAGVQRKSWASPVSHGNCIDMQFDHPGWKPDGVQTKIVLTDGTTIVSGKPYQRRARVEAAR